MITLRTNTPNSDMTLSLRTELDEIRLNKLYLNKKLITLIERKKLNKYLQYANIEFVNDIMILTLRDVESNSFRVNKVSDNAYSISFTNSVGKKRSLNQRLTKNLLKGLTEVVKDNPSVIIFELVKISANLLFFKILNKVYCVSPGNPNETMTHILRDAIFNNNLIKEIITNDGTFE